MLLRILSVAMIFQSTPSARRATRFFLHIAGQVNISIHALREEGDSSCCARSSRGGRFQSTPSARRATTALWWSTPSSAHFNPRPPRGGRPANQRRVKFDIRNFNPRPPRGGRLHRLLHSASRRTISIHALREEGDYEYFDAGLVGHGISIHALREEGDGPAGFFFLQILHFNPRPPRGGRQRILRNRPVVDDISIHALREEGDRGHSQQ